ncbi:hypothetical protein FHR20_000008 [Sphingomonas leidyi]|uniref:Uncharacterized protein n=1 Tax=Sphingomonas leidyi TaxID=68569 RepID=A0A7X5UWP6_9SPHN|nr:hypothetical protein [Sphingomonas leidyi]NIJ63077.1 hypothetical protein [Sphingomonas leidyi]
MSIRSTRSTVTFASPFRLKATGEILPPGSYEVETDEEAIEGNGHIVYRRVATLLYVPTASGTRVCTVDPAELAAAIAADAQRAPHPEAS